MGLLGVLAKQFTGVLLAHPAYIAFTMIIGGYRVTELHGSTTIETLWNVDYFGPLSIVHKIVAAMYVGERAKQASRSASLSDAIFV